MIKINGIEWRVLQVSPSHPYLFRSDGVKVLGCCDNFAQIIYIDNSLSKKQWKKVLCHEITHAAMFSYKVELSAEQEELVANLISTYGEEIVYITNQIFKKL